MITKEQIKRFRVDFEKAVKQLAEEYDVEISLGAIRYNEADFHSTMTVKAKTIGDVEHEEFAFKRDCRYAGLKPEHYGKTIKSGLKTLTVSGINPKARKNSVILKDALGNKYVSSPFMVLALLK